MFKLFLSQLCNNRIRPALSLADTEMAETTLFQREPSDRLLLPPFSLSIKQSHRHGEDRGFDTLASSVWFQQLLRVLGLVFLFLQFRRDNHARVSCHSAVINYHMATPLENKVK